MHEAQPQTLERLMRWYADQCDGEWEHCYGVKIDTLDNPGCRFRIGTRGARAPLPHVPEPTGWGPEGPDRDWMVHWVEDGTFRAYGDPSKSEPMLRLFLDLVDRGRH